MTGSGMVCLFGPGYCGKAIAGSFRRDGVAVSAIGRDPPASTGEDIARADIIVSTVPPDDGGDPILAAHGEAMATSGARLIYLSSTGVYGDARGGWVDESTPLAGRREHRVAADLAWLARGATVLRLPGIYGPGRSVVDRLQAGQASRIDVPGQVFSRIHVDDVVGAVRAAAAARSASGAYNIADDLPAPQADLVRWTAERLGLPVPPLLTLDQAALSPAARAFYAENRRVANGKARRLLGWRPLHPDYRAGLRALIASARPSTTRMPPAIDVADQR